MTWVMRWRERVIANESNERKDDRGNRKNTIDTLKKQQLRLTRKIQFHGEEYDRLVVNASLRKAPTQNGSQRRGFIASAQMEHRSELALRPPDRQIYSRVYSKVDKDRWRLDEARTWYNKKADERREPWLPLESYGYKAVGYGRTLENGTYIAPPQQRPFPELLPLPPDAPRISVSACQAREVARRPPREHQYHWSDFTGNLSQQLDKVPKHPLYGCLDVCAPPFRNPPPPSTAMS